LKKRLLSEVGVGVQLGPSAARLREGSGLSEALENRTDSILSFFQALTRVS
jgi:hypothetical protein